MAVYFAQAPNGSIKIGRSRHPEYRVSNFQLGGERATLLATIQSRPMRYDGVTRKLIDADDKKLEHELHVRFAAHRIGGRRSEWFRPCPELLDLIAKSKATGTEGR